MTVITKGRDKNFYIRLRDENQDVIKLTNWTSIIARFLKSDGTALAIRAPLTAAVNEVQTLTFDDVPDSGSFKIKATNSLGHTEETALISWDDDAAAIQTALNSLTFLIGMIVTGDFTAGFPITFAGGSGGRNWTLLETTTNTLKKVAADVTPTIVETTVGIPESGIDVIDAEAGKAKVTLSEEDTALLQLGESQDLDLIVKIGSVDLNIEPLVQVLKIRESIF